MRKVKSKIKEGVEKIADRSQEKLEAQNNEIDETELRSWRRRMKTKKRSEANGYASTEIYRSPSTSR